MRQIVRFFIFYTRTVFFLNICACLYCLINPTIFRGNSKLITDILFWFIVITNTLQIIFHYLIKHLEAKETSLFEKGLRDFAEKIVPK